MPNSFRASGISCQPTLFVDPVLCVAAPMAGARQDHQLLMPFVSHREKYIISPYIDWLSFFFNRSWRKPMDGIASLMIKLADVEQGDVHHGKMRKTKLPKCKKQEDLLGTAVFGDPGLASSIQNDKLGIGLNNIGYAYDEKTRTPNPGLLVCPVDGNSDGRIDAEEYFYDTKDDFIAAVAENKYPSPPARDLYMVAHGVPSNPAVVAFLKFILTEGQQYNVPVGYIGLTEEKLAKGLDALKAQ